MEKTRFRESEKLKRMNADSSISSSSEAFRRGEERLRLAALAGRVGLWEWNITEGRMLWSEAMFMLHGVSSATFRPSFEGCLELVHPDDRAMVRQATQNAVENNRPFLLEVRVVRPD